MRFDREIVPEMDRLISSAQGLIRINSVQAEPAPDMPFGKGMDDALNYVLDLAESMGFATHRINGYCGYIEYGEGDTYIGIFGHVDVNSENTRDWKHDPYEAAIDDNKIYGACAVDKSALIAALFALRAVRDSGVRLRRKIRIIVGTDERRYYRDMVHYLDCEPEPIAGFAVDGHFPATYCEKAISMLEFRKHLIQGSSEYIKDMEGGKIENIVPWYCKAHLVTSRKSELLEKAARYSAENRKNVEAKPVDDGVIIEVFGLERHCAAIERGINSIAVMMDFLNYVSFGENELKDFISFIAKHIGTEIYGESMNISFEDADSGRTTVNLGTIEMINSDLVLRLDCRFPVTSNYYSGIETINSLFAQAGFRNTECTYWPPTYFPKNHFLITALLDSYREVSGDESAPVSSTSASYSKIMPNIAAFGAHYPGQGIIWDQSDEYVDLDSLKITAEIYASAIYKLCTEI